jgi:uracil phosphoribosyltransferase
MPLHQGMLDIWDKADSAFVSAYRKHHALGFDIEVEYLGAPNVAGRQLVLVDPMVATGASLQAAYNALCETGAPDQLHVVSAIASRDGLRNAQAWLPEGTTFLVGGVDPKLDERGYIVPGLGDAGDLAFGPKTRS